MKAEIKLLPSKKIMLIGQMERSLIDILKDFSKPIPPEYLKTKPVFKRNRQTGKSEKTGDVTYAPWGAYINILLQYAPGYSWEIRTQYLTDKVIVEGRLTISAKEGSFVYESTGVQDISSNNYGDALYDAEASAMRRAAAKAGLGLHLWSNETKSNNYSSNNYKKSSFSSKPKQISHLKIKPKINNKLEPWKQWKSQDDALAYAMNQIPEMHMNVITQEWEKLIPEEIKDSRTGKTRYVKGRAWVQRVQELKEIPF